MWCNLRGFEKDLAKWVPDLASYSEETDAHKSNPYTPCKVLFN